MSKYRITDIQHSGRIGQRGTPYTGFGDYKNCIVELPYAVDSHQRFYQLKFKVLTQPLGVLNTSAVIQIEYKNNKYCIETINAIYSLEKVSDESDETCKEEICEPREVLYWTISYYENGNLMWKEICHENPNVTSNEYYLVKAIYNDNTADII